MVLAPGEGSVSRDEVETESGLDRAGTRPAVTIGRNAQRSNRLDAVPQGYKIQVEPAGWQRFFAFCAGAKWHRRTAQ